MSRKAFILMVLAVFCAASLAMAADDAKKTPPVTAAAAKDAAGRQMQYPKPEFTMITGTVEKIDTSDPANIRVTVKSDKDQTSRTLTVMPWTNITKSAEITELKQGEAVRVMARKSQDKEVAMGIMFGKMPMPPKQALPPQAAAAQAKVKAPAKK